MKNRIGAQQKRPKSFQFALKL